MRRRHAAVLLCLLAAIAAGCGGRAPSDEEQVRDKLAELARATEDKDYKTLCTRVLSSDVLEGITQIGLPCEVALRNALGDVEDPQLTVGKVTVNGDRATADVRTTAAGQQPSRDRVTLVKVAQGWRVSSLSGGEAAAASPTPTPTP